MRTKQHLNRLLLLTLSIIFLFCFVLGLSSLVGKTDKTTINIVYAENNSVLSEDTAESKTACGQYLSNLTPITSEIGYSTLKTDKNINGDQISFIINKERQYFKKGIIAHATSTLVYDIGENHNYDFFSTYLGIDAVQNGKGSVKFSVYSSLDNQTWQTELSPLVKTSGDEATFLKFSVQNVRYLKFIFDSNGSDNYDHSGLGDCKLFSENYDFDKAETLIYSVDYYDNLLSGKTSRQMIEENTKTVMQRSFIEKIGYDNLKDSLLIGEDETKNREMLSWLLNDETALKDFVTGGVPNGGSYINALKVLSLLYEKHSTDLDDKNALFEPEAGSTRTRGDVYRTMMISIALTHARGPYSWVSPSEKSDPIKRYEAFKYVYLAPTYHLRYDIFENLCVEEMRYLMSNRINNDEIYWVNAYLTIKNGGATYPKVYSPHSHIRYGRDWNYSAKGYYEEENFEKYNQKYMLEEYGVYFSTSPKLWMVLEGSQICWGISYLGTSFTAGFGVPSHYVRQPDHAAFLVYSKDADGRTIWTIDNDIFGWTKTWMNEDTVGNGNNRMMCDWGTTGSEQVKNYNGTYILLASTALDNQQNYEKAELILSLKNLTEQDNLEELYRYALSVMPYHLDAWMDLIKLYINTSASDEQLTNLAEEIAQNMYMFPLPMHELIGLIKTELTTRNTTSSLIQLANVENINNLYLQKATKVSQDDNAKNIIAQTSPCIEEAKYLLGLTEEDKLASFSFDGENKNKLVFNSKYTSVRYIYSLNGGTSWSDTFVTSDGLAHELTESKLNSISSTNDIYIWLEGWGTINLEKAFKIDILDGEEITNLESNDNENKFFGTFTNVEYSVDNINWQDLTEESIFYGAQTIYVRYKRNGLKLQGTSSTFEFTDNTNEKRNYIPINNLELFAYSSEETSRNDYAKYAIDGKLSTRWHTKWSGGDSDRFLTVKLDKQRYISGIDYTPCGGNGTMQACNVYVSIDGENWILAGSVSGWGNNTTKKSISFTPVLGQYVKVVGTSTVGGFCSARLLEFFEDTTLADKNILKLEVEDIPKINVYVSGQTINYLGLKTKIVFEDNSFAIIPNELLTLETITFSTIGSQVITIKYADYQTTFNVEVIDVSDGIARIGTTYFSSLENAVTSISDGTSAENVIELLKNIEVTGGFTITKKIIINGNNYLLTRTADYLGAIFTVSGNGNLTLNDIVIDGGAIWSGDTNEILGRGNVNSGIIATSPLIKATDTATLQLVNCMLKNNYNNYSTNAQNTGGAIFLGSKSNASLINTSIKNCYSYFFGSAIYTRDTASLTINGGEFLSNSGNSKYNTSLFCIDNTSVCVVNGGQFKNNLAFSKGGAFWVGSGSLTINEGNFENNYATTGAGIYLNGNAKIYISDFEKMGDIYIPSGKYIYLFGMLLNKDLNLTLANTTDDTIIAVCEDEEIKYKVLKAIKVQNKLLYVDGNNIKLGATDSAKAYIVNGENQTLFTDLIQAIKCADANDTITLNSDITLTEEIYIDKTICISLSNFLLSGINKITTDENYCLKYSDNLINISEHIYNLNITYTWSEDYLTCTATLYCECNKPHTETVTAKKVITTPASYETEELSNFIAEFTNPYLTTQEKNNIVTGNKLIKPQKESSQSSISSQNKTDSQENISQSQDLQSQTSLKSEDSLKDTSQTKNISQNDSEKSSSTSITLNSNASSTQSSTKTIYSRSENKNGKTSCKIFANSNNLFLIPLALLTIIVLFKKSKKR